MHVVLSPNDTMNVNRATRTSTLRALDTIDPTPSALSSRGMAVTSGVSLPATLGTMDERWNHNIEYHKVIRRALADRPLATVLDVGTGEGNLAADLARMGARVTAIDLDPACVARAASQDPTVDFVVGDFMVHPFGPGAFDAVVSVAALHHMHEADALCRMAELLRPGGTLAVVGLARREWPGSWPWDLAGAVTTRLLRRRHGGCWEPDTAKVWPPPSSYSEIETTARSVLPGVRFRRHVLWRYSLVWTKPSAPTSA